MMMMFLPVPKKHSSGGEQAWKAEVEREKGWSISGRASSAWPLHLHPGPKPLLDTSSFGTAEVSSALRARVGSGSYAPAGASRTLATVVFGHICGEREGMGASGLDPASTSHKFTLRLAPWCRGSPPDWLGQTLLTFENLLDVLASPCPGGLAALRACEGHGAPTQTKRIGDEGNQRVAPGGHEAGGLGRSAQVIRRHIRAEFPFCGKPLTG